VIIGETVTGIDGELGIPPGGVIAGRITDPYGRPFDFARVTAYEWDGTVWLPAGQAEPVFSESEYALPLPPGEYRLYFEGGSFLQPDLPAQEFYDDVASIDDGTSVAVALDERIEGLDVAVGNLSTGAISGTVSDTATGAPLSGIEVWVADRKGRELYDQVATTDVDGGYTVSGLWPEGYFVTFYDPRFTYQTLRTGPVLVAEEPVGGVDAQGGSAVRQCIAVEAGSSYRFGGWSRAAVSGSVEPTVEARLEFFGDPDCAGSPLTAAVSPVRTGAHDWRPVTGVASAPVEAAAARLALVVHSPAPATFTVHLDEAFAGPDTDLVFADGFESATVSAWSLPVP
jgi:hypothetical protein